MTAFVSKLIQLRELAMKRSADQAKTQQESHFVIEADGTASLE